MKKSKGKKKSGGPPPPPPPPMMESNMASNSNFEQDLNVMEAPRAKKVGFKNVQVYLRNKESFFECNEVIKYGRGDQIQ